MIEVKNLSKYYNGIKILDSISFNINKGEKCIIVGKSGSGKSVLLRHLIGLEFPDEGEVLIEGVSTVSPSFNRIRKKMGMVFQDGALFDYMTVAENVGFYLYFNEGIRGKKLLDLVNDMLIKVGLPDVMDKYPSQLSGGMAKRVAIARTMIYKPYYILYDEPTTGLDPQTSSHIVELIRKLHNKDMTMIMITHDMDVAGTMADILVVMEGDAKWSVYRGSDIKNIINNIETGGQICMM